ncbi:MAG: AAA family ATPase, partial [Rhodospirillaceae bacterium]|nr:AAA family ATPase [Rhodospirillaceae bacterium]
MGLTAFRSWRSVRLEVPARSVVLTGPNGAGKTNLLEALSLLAPGRGLRRARMAALQTRGEAAAPETDRSEPSRPESPWAVSARLDTPDGPRRVGTGLDPALDPAANPESAPGRRILRIDGIPAKGQGDLAALGAVSWLTPEMDGLFTGPAGERRRFLDRLVAGFLPGHAAHVAAYGKAMRERNRLLREPGAEAAWLDALEAGMAERGVAVAVARADFTARLAAACAGRVSA